MTTKSRPARPAAKAARNPKTAKAAGNPKTAKAAGNPKDANAASKSKPAKAPGRFRTPRLAWGADGLLPAIARDVSTGQVLVLAWTDREALKKTFSTGLVHFWSRKRKALWLKGETSGNVLRLVEASTDCDGDALLYQVEPAGPACHTGATSCFFERLGPGTATSAEAGRGRFGWDELHGLVLARKRDMPRGSYTTKLFEAGLDRIAQKVGEEAVETILSARQGEPGLFIGEVADLIYHLTVLMAAVGVSPAQVEELLRERHEQRKSLQARKGAPARQARRKPAGRAVGGRPPAGRAVGGRPLAGRSVSGRPVKR